MKSSWLQFYEAETQGLEGKMLNVKAKAMTVEKITDNKE